MTKPSNSTYVIMGLGADKKPHAARFDAVAVAQAANAAKLMGFQLGKAETAEAIGLAKHLPKGRIFTQGRALVPITKATLYEKLSRALSFIEGAELENAIRPATPAIDANAAWSSIEVGQLVLYGGKLAEDGWWEAIVVSVSDDKQALTLRWRGAMHEKPFKARKGEVGVILPFDVAP